ncbi:hypothetical protein CR513_01350, partial [Mucuna pruriens]
MAKDRSIFKDIDKSFEIKVRLGNGSIVESKGNNTIMTNEDIVTQQQQKFKALLEKQSGKYIKVLRSDHSKEYNSYEFDRFCEDEGVERQLTVAYSP